MDTILSRLAPGQTGRSRGPNFTVSRRGPVSMTARFFALLLTWQERSRQRHALVSLDDRMLKDIGLRRADVFLEARKPFWRA